jgi:hypothetical protein
MSRFELNMTLRKSNCGVSSLKALRPGSDVAREEQPAYRLPQVTSFTEEFYTPRYSLGLEEYTIMQSFFPWFHFYRDE